MGILIFSLIVIAILALAIYGINQIPMEAPLGLILKLLAVVIAIIAIANQAGFV